MFSVNAQPSDGILESIRARVHAKVCTGDDSGRPEEESAAQAPSDNGSNSGSRPTSASSTMSSTAARVAAKIEAHYGRKAAEASKIPMTEEEVEAAETSALLARLTGTNTSTAPPAPQPVDPLSLAAKVYGARPQSASTRREYVPKNAPVKPPSRPASAASSRAKAPQISSNCSTKPTPSASSADASAAQSRQSSARSQMRRGSCDSQSGRSIITDQDSVSRDCAQVAQNWAKDAMKLQDTNERRDEEEIKRLHKKIQRLMNERTGLQSAVEAATATTLRVEQRFKASEIAREKAEQKLQASEAAREKAENRLQMATERVKIAEETLQRTAALEAALEDANYQLRAYEEKNLESKVSFLREELQKKDQRLRQLIEMHQTPY